MRVVLVRLSSLGDIVHTWPLAATIRAARPDIHLTWVVEEHFRPLVAGHPAVDGVLTVATRRWRRRPFAARTRAEAALVRGRLRELGPDLALDPQGVVKSALVTHWTGAPRRVGFARPWRRESVAALAYTETIPGSAGAGHVVALYLAMARAVAAEAPSAAVDPDGGWLLRRLGIPPGLDDGGDPPALLLPGAGQPRKELPLALLAEVARGLAAGGLPVVVGWGPGERGRAEAVVKLAGDHVRLAPPTDLEELAALLARSRVVIGGDTGPVHLSASFGVPTVAVFTATDWQRNRPLGARVEGVTGARPRRGRSPASARAEPVRQVAADEVLELVDRVLERPSP